MTPPRGLGWVVFERPGSLRRLWQKGPQNPLGLESLAWIGRSDDRYFFRRDTMRQAISAKAPAIQAPTLDSGTIAKTCP